MSERNDKAIKVAKETLDKLFYGEIILKCERGEIIRLLITESITTDSIVEN